jgi:hypothetical protein
VFFPARSPVRRLDKIQSGVVTRPVVVIRQGWVLGAAALLVFAGVAVGVHFWRVQRPPAPSAARLPASVRALLQPFRKDSLDLRVGARQELNYRVGMQAGATLIYAWSTGYGRAGEALVCEFAGRQIEASEAHSGFVAQSAGWYRWRWKNQNSHSVTIHFKLSGAYEPESVPPVSMPYDK